MKIYLTNIPTGDKRRRCMAPYEGADHAVVDGACPLCKAQPFKVQGTGARPSSDDRAREASAVAVCCGRAVGTIRAEADTLFGMREDQAVLEHGRCRIY